jgi:hypothetical protein
MTWKDAFPRLCKRTVTTKLFVRTGIPEKHRPPLHTAGAQIVFPQNNPKKGEDS